MRYGMLMVARVAFPDGDIVQAVSFLSADHPFDQEVAQIVQDALVLSSLQNNVTVIDVATSY